MSHVSLPDEVWERIFCYLPSIGSDLIICSVVSRRFRNIVRTIKSRQRIFFEKKLKSPGWSECVNVSRILSPVTKLIRPARFNFSSAVLRADLYIFGGFTDNQTSMQDLWKFSIQHAHWERILCTTVPSAVGGATMVADHKHNRLLLFGGRFINNTQPALRSPRSHLPNIFRNELHFINISIRPTNWISLALPDRPTGRANAAGCLIPDLDILLLDGGQTERRLETEEDQSTFILDTKLHSTTSWRWVPDVKIGGVDLPLNRSQHQICCTGASSFIMMGAGTGPVNTQFLFGDITVTEIRRHPDLDIPPIRRFDIILTQLTCSIPSTLPCYLQGSKANYEPSSQILYWLSPVPKSKSNLSQSGLGLYRLKLDPESKELHGIGKSPALEISSSDGTVPCLLGHALGPNSKGLILYGGAVASDNSTNVWEGLDRIQQVPTASNDLFFLQMF